MNRRQNNNQWSSGIAAQPAQTYRVKNTLEKFVASIFWDQGGILHNDYLPKGLPINVTYYSSLLVQLKDVLKEKRRGKIIKLVLFLHENTTAHWSHTTQKKLSYLSFQCLDQTPYSRDLDQSDCYLFPGLKGKLKFRHFSFDAEVIAAAETR